MFYAVIPLCFVPIVAIRFQKVVILMLDKIPDLFRCPCCGRIPFYRSGTVVHDQGKYIDTVWVECDCGLRIRTLRDCGDDLFNRIECARLWNFLVAKLSLR